MKQQYDRLVRPLLVASQLELPSWGVAGLGPQAA